MVVPEGGFGVHSKDQRGRRCKHLRFCPTRKPESEPTTRCWFL